MGKSKHCEGRWPHELDLLRVDLVQELICSESPWDRLSYVLLTAWSGWSFQASEGLRLRLVLVVERKRGLSIDSDSGYVVADRLLCLDR